MSRWRSALATAALVLVGTLCAALVGELAVRLYEKDPLLPLVPPEPYVDNAILYRKSPTRRYELRPGVDATVGPNRVRIRINAAGFRDEVDYPEDKPASTYRIVVLGDSFTFAGKVSLAETLPKRLEEYLAHADPSKRYEVLNLAVPGYNTEQEAALLEEVGLRYHPDMVLVAFVLNDALPAGQLIPARARMPEPVRRVLKRSYLVQFLYDREQRLRSTLKKGGFKGASDVQDLVAGTPGFTRVEAAFGRMREATSAHGVALLVAIWPMFERLDDYPFTDRHALVSQTCSRLGIPMFDLLSTFRGGDASAFWVSRNDHHPNSDAQQRAAAALVAPIREVGGR